MMRCRVRVALRARPDLHGALETVERRGRVVDGRLKVGEAGCWSSLRSARRIEDRIAAAAGDFEVVIQAGAGCRRST